MKELEMMLESREVAEMVGKEHNKLMRDIRNYIAQLGESKIGHTDFFTESTYKSSQNKEMPCFFVTKKGCEFIAHKLTGVKGTEFTARYINRFHEMEEKLEQAVTPQTESKTKLAPANGWFKKVNPKMIEVIETNYLTRKRLYHIILTRISNKYDWYGALATFKKERGFDPVFPMDVVAYFPEMQEEAERILDRLAQPLFSTMEFPEDAPFDN